MEQGNLHYIWPELEGTKHLKSWSISTFSLGELLIVDSPKM